MYGGKDTGIEIRYLKASPRNRPRHTCLRLFVMLQKNSRRQVDCGPRTFALSDEESDCAIAPPELRGDV